MNWKRLWAIATFACGIALVGIALVFPNVTTAVSAAFGADPGGGKDGGP